MISATGTLADINPLRYRGYYYDSETKLYHLWSRYYDPQTGRFISADSYASTGQGVLGNNMFAYCGNDPIQNIDSLGYFGICVLNDPMNVYRAYTTPGMFGGGGGFGIPEVSSSYFAMQNVREYDSWWQNSCYNPNMTWSNGVISPQAANYDVFNSFVETPQSIYGKTSSDISNMLGDSWKQGTYGSKGHGWKFNNGDKMIAYHPGGGRHVGSYYVLSSGPTGRIKIVGPDYIESIDDKATIIWAR